MGSIGSSAMNVKLKIAMSRLINITKNDKLSVEPQGSGGFVLCHPSHGFVSPSNGLTEDKLADWIHAFIAGYRWKESN